MHNDGKSNDGRDSETTKYEMTRSQRFYLELFSVTLTVFFGMFTYEYLKTYFLPKLTIWESHLITIVFSTVIATLAAYVILKRYNKLLDKITEKSNSYRLALNELNNTKKNSKKYLTMPMIWCS